MRKSGRWYGVLVAASLTASGCSAILGISVEPYDVLDATVDGGGTEASTSGDADGGGAEASSSGDADGNAARDSAVDSADSARADSSPPVDAVGIPDARQDASDTGTPTCSCAATVSGWSGPVALYAISTPAPVPVCPPSFPIEITTGNDGLDAGPATCSACTCDTATLGCGATEVLVTSSTSCNPASSMSCSTTSLEAGTCSQIPPIACAGGAPNLSASSTVDGGCAPAGGAPTGSPPTWALATLACGPDDDGGTCTSGICVPPQPINSSLCVYQTGVPLTPCPPEYPTRSPSYQTYKDARVCTACSCGGPAGTCTTHVLAFSSTDCGGDAASGVGTQVGTCTPQGATMSVKASAPAGLTTGSCPTAGGTPTGSVTADSVGATTFCCTP